MRTRKSKSSDGILLRLLGRTHFSLTFPKRQSFDLEDLPHEYCPRVQQLNATTTLLSDLNLLNFFIRRRPNNRLHSNAIALHTQVCDFPFSTVNHFARFSVPVTTTRFFLFSILITASLPYAAEHLARHTGAASDNCTPPSLSASFVLIYSATRVYVSTTLVIYGHSYRSTALPSHISTKECMTTHRGAELSSLQSAPFLGLPGTHTTAATHPPVHYLQLTTTIAQQVGLRYLEHYTNDCGLNHCTSHNSLELPVENDDQCNLDDDSATLSTILLVVYFWLRPPRSRRNAAISLGPEIM